MCKCPGRIISGINMNIFTQPVHIKCLGDIRVTIITGIFKA
jgi:hypothetical protein